MSRLTIYLETSVWSFAFADDVPDYRRDTMAFLELCREGRFATFVSPVVLAEINHSDQPLRERLSALVHQVAPTALTVTPEAERLAQAFMRERVVPAKKPEDALHVAVAFAGELDVLVSWNFRHIASLRRADRFNAVAVLEGFYKPLRIVTPAEVIYDDEVDEV